MLVKQTSKQEYKTKPVDAPLECFPEGLLGNDSSTECADVCSAFSRLLPTPCTGVSDLEAT